MGIQHLKSVACSFFVVPFGVILFFSDLFLSPVFSAMNTPTDTMQTETSGPLYLYKSPQETLLKKKEFAEALFRMKPDTSLRPLYEKYIDDIGANGILDVVQALRPTCHSEAHPLGMVIFGRLKRIGPAVQACREGCYSGCMHGVFMEAFKLDEKSGHSHSAPGNRVLQILPGVRGKLPTICNEASLTQSYRAGDCAHAVGHAMMYILDYDIPRTIGHCKLFNEVAMKYYCATGAYMEYVTLHDPKDSQKTLFYPCDIGDYPAGCFRYKMVHVVRRHYAEGRDIKEIVTRCMALKNRYRLGCFHGIGNAHMGVIALGQMRISVVCGFGTKEDQYVCIDGAVERMGKFYPDIAKVRCLELVGWKKDLCNAGVARGMYTLNKSFEFYVR